MGRWGFVVPLKMAAVKQKMELDILLIVYHKKSQ
jgi:hypothetical protein